jgi:hypothetical protein
MLRLPGPTLMNFLVAGTVTRRDWLLNTGAMTNLGWWNYAIYLWQHL